MAPISTPRATELLDASAITEGEFRFVTMEIGYSQTLVRLDEAVTMVERADGVFLRDDTARYRLAAMTKEGTVIRFEVDAQATT